MPAHPRDVSRRSRRTWGAVLAISLAATALLAWPAAGLRIESRLTELLPLDLPASADYRRFLDVFGGMERIFVLVSTGEDRTDPERLADAAELLADRLEQASVVDSARWGVLESDEEFFLRDVLPRAALLLPVDALPELHDRLEPAAIRARVRLMRAKLGGPTGEMDGALFAADPLGLAEGISGLRLGGGSWSPDPLTGAFLSPAGDAALVMLTPVATELDAEAGRALLEALEEGYAAVRAGAGDEFEFAAVGGALYAAQDETIIRGDVSRTVGGSALLITLMLWWFFRGLRIPLVLAFSVFAALIWTAALTIVFHGQLTVVGIAFGSILLGLGVDYGIHGATRFRQESRPGRSSSEAMSISLHGVGAAILASAATTTVAFLVLSLARFGPVRELGQIVALGILALVGASLAIGAALLVLLPGAPASAATESGISMLSRVVTFLVGLGSGHPRTVVTLLVVGSLIAAVGVSRLGFQADLRDLRPEDHPAWEAEATLSETFGVGLDTVTVLLRGEDLGDALSRAAGMTSRLRSELGAEVEVVSPSDWIVGGPVLEQRLAAWSAAGRLEESLRVLEEELEHQGFAVAAFEPSLSVLRSVARGDAPPRIVPEAWPSWLADSVRHVPGGVEIAVRLNAPIGLWPDGPQTELIEMIRGGDPEVAVASAARLGSALRGLVGGEFRRLGGWCLIAIGGMVLLSFRGRPRPALLSMLPVLLGSLWLLGLYGWLGYALDPLTIAVAPLLLGIGIDDGLHALHGSRVHGGLVPALEQVGQAMTLTTLTTCVGFGSLIFSRVPALRLSGLLVASGTLFCLLATLVVLPALDRLIRRPAKRTTG